MYIKKLKIGNVELKNNLILAPMAGVTNQPFRIICKKFGPGMVCTEMASSKAIFYNDQKTKRLFNTEGEKRPISFQIFGSDEETMAYAAKYVSNFADIVDINMGCPAPKVVKNGDGSKLLLDLEKAEKIIEAVVENSTVPVTLKIRKGWDKQHIVAVELAKIAEQAGISAITVHGRTRADFYTGNADWEIIKKVKENVKIPVIGNGDIVDEESAKKMFEQTGVDDFMGRPKGGKNKYWSKEEKLKLIKEHLDNNISTNEITTRENISNGMYNNWLKKYLEYGEKGLENKKKPGNPLSKYMNKKQLNDIEKLEYENMKLRIENERLKKGYMVEGDGQVVIFNGSKNKNLK